MPGFLLKSHPDCARICTKMSPDEELVTLDVAGCEIALQCLTFRPRLELHANKMQWYLATLNQPECHEVNIF